MHEREKSQRNLQPNAVREIKINATVESTGLKQESITNFTWNNHIVNLGNTTSLFQIYNRINIY